MEDCIKAFVGTNTKVWVNGYNDTTNLYTLSNSYSNIEISLKLAFTANGGRIEFTDSSHYIGVGVGGDGVNRSYYIVTGSEVMQELGNYTANSEMTIKLIREGNTLKSYLNGTLAQSVTNSNVTSSINKILLRNWNVAKTMTYTDLKVKPL